MKNSILTLVLFSSMTNPTVAFAETSTETSIETSTAKSAPAKQFEIIDGNAPIDGEPGLTSEAARGKWSKACSEWKAETKELNRKNEVLSLVCGSADCAYQENGTYICSSTAVYKVKTEGVKAPPAPIPTPAVASAKSGTYWASTTKPPEVIYEVRPAPQAGFIWVPGVWGWQNHRHVWYPGHWQVERPGQVWINHSWSQRGNRWHFELGHWGHHHH